MTHNHGDCDAGLCFIAERNRALHVQEEAKDTIAITATIYDYDLRRYTTTTHDHGDSAVCRTFIANRNRAPCRCAQHNGQNKGYKGVFTGSGVPRYQT